jgi:hypothetical protein
MKKILPVIILFSGLQTFCQSPVGFWYGSANVKLNNTYSNYLVELIIEQQGNNVKGVLNYYFRNTYRSIPVWGTYNKQTRMVFFKDIPVSYYGAYFNRDVDCQMNLSAKLLVSKAGSNIKGSFISHPQYKYTCPEITFNLKLNSGAINKDSIMRAIGSQKERFQVWRPSESDTFTAVSVVQRKVVNFVIDNEYKKRDNELVQEITVQSDSLKIDFYDNGEIDGDSISVFFNNELMAFNRILSTRSVHFDIVLDNNKPVNELSMFADNLGAIPPNTALMVVNDGKKRYEVRLSSNFEKNATIRIKRKKP